MQDVSDPLVYVEEKYWRNVFGYEKWCHEENEILEIVQKTRKIHEYNTVAARVAERASSRLSPINTDIGFIRFFLVSAIDPAP